MRRPPLISYLTFNRLGNTAITLPSLLRTYDDFELYLIDNGSRDDTWQFLQDTRDPRIKHKKRFEDNVGGAHGLNYALSFRKQDQDWINFEYDVRLHDKNFVQHFQAYYQAFPEFGGFSAVLYPEQLQLVESLIIKEPPRQLIKEDKRVYVDSIMGFCSYIPYEVMNQLGFYDEVNCLLDIELNQRIINCLHKRTGYALSIHCSQTAPGGECSTCIAYHEPCHSNRKCLKYYGRIITKVTETVGTHNIEALTKKRSHGKLPIKCGSIFSTDVPMSEEDIEASKRIMALFKQYTDEFLQTVVIT